MATYKFDTDYGPVSFEHDGDPKELFSVVDKWTADQGVKKALTDTSFMESKTPQGEPTAYDPNKDLSQFLEPHTTPPEPSTGLTRKHEEMTAQGIPASQQPIAPIPYLPGKIEDFIDQIPNPAGIPQSVIARGIVDTANFFQSPLGIGTLGIGALPGAAQKLIGGIFASTALKNAPEKISDYFKANNPDEKRTALTGIVEDAAMIGGPLFHVMTEARRANRLFESGAPITGQKVLDQLPQKVAAREQEISNVFPEMPKESRDAVHAAIVRQESGQPLDARDKMVLNNWRAVSAERAQGGTTAKEIEAMFNAPKEAPQPPPLPAEESGKGGQEPGPSKTDTTPSTPAEVPAAAEPTINDEAKATEPTSEQSTVAAPEIDSPRKAETESETQESSLKGKDPLAQLRALEEDAQASPVESPSKFNPDDVEAYASKLPETVGGIVRDVIGKGRSIEDAAADHGVTVKKAQEMVDKAGDFLSRVNSITPLAGRSYVDEPSVEARADSPEVEAVKDWTSATEESKPATPKMKRGGEEAGTITLSKFANRKMSELDQATTNRSAKMQKSFDEAKRAQTEINKAVPSPKRQAAISVWMEANGDPLLLQGWESTAQQKWFRDAVKLARTLTPEEIAIANKARAAFDVLKNRGKKFDVLNSGRDEYVPHVWDFEKDGKGFFGGGKLQQTLRFAKARVLDTFADGDFAGFKPKTLEIGKLLPAYLQEMNKVIADRQFVQELEDKNMSDERPAYVPRGRVSTVENDSGGKAYLANPDAFKKLKDKAGNPIDTSDYRTLENQPALHDWRWEGKDTEGNPIFMHDDLAVHPDVAKRLDAMLGKSQLPVPKFIDKAQSVLKREMFGLLAPFHQVQEGTHAIAHRVNPLFGIERVDMRQPKFMDAARHGLMMLPDRTSSASYMEGLGGKGTFATQILRWFGEKNDKLTNRAATALANVVDGYQDYLFHKYIPSLKFKTYEAALSRNMKVYEKELKSNTMTAEDVKLTSAEQVNAAYGHLNLALLDRNPTMQHLNQLLFLAPDFLEARGRFVAQAGKGLLGSKVGEEQFKALAFIAIVQAGSAYILSKLSGNDWNPKKPFSVVTKDREYTMRSVPEDLLRLGVDISGLVKGGNAGIPFISARINPMLETVGQFVSGRNYRGEKTDWKDTAEELFAKYIPITARSIPGIRELTETSRQNPVSPLEQLAGSMGLKISRYSPISDTYIKAAEWMQSNGQEKDRGSYPVSKYQQLRYALEDGDMDKAQSEYNKLKKKSSPDEISKGFGESINHPFTKNKAMDRQFASSLNQSDKSIYDLAELKRGEILQRFNTISPTAVRQHADEEEDISPLNRIKSGKGIRKQLGEKKDRFSKYD